MTRWALLLLLLLLGTTACATWSPPASNPVRAAEAAWVPADAPRDVAGHALDVEIGADAASAGAAPSAVVSGTGSGAASVPGAPAAGVPAAAGSRAPSAPVAPAGATVASPHDADAEAADDDDGSPWSTDVGGQIRYRFQRESNKALNGTSPEQNDYHLLRTRLHGELRHEDGFRAFVELLDARIHDNERPATAIDRNNLDIQNLYGELELTDGLGARVGRTEMQYGAQRLISPLDWGNTRRTFDGGVLRWEGEGGSADLFVTRPVIVDPRDSDDRDSSRWFSGLYTTWDLGEHADLDVYGLALNETDDVLMGEGGGGAGDHDRYTYGARLWGKRGAFDYEVEAAQQIGQLAGDDIHAAMGTLRVGWTFPEVRLKPRLGFDFDYASGDDDPTDGRRETFNQLFPLGHAWFGYMDLVGRQNIIAYQPNLTLAVHERATLRFAYHAFQLAEDNDALYNAGGAATLVDPTGSSGTDVGNELDVTLAITPECWPGTHVLLGWSRFEPGSFVDTVGDDDDSTLAYLQFTFDF